MSKRRRPVVVRDEERVEILAMLAAGYDQASVARTLQRDERTIMAVVSQHRAKMREQDEAEFFSIFKDAARAAAVRGNHVPALEWLDRMGSIPESSRQRTAIQQARVAAEGQAAVTRHLQAGGGHPATVNIAIGAPAQLTEAGFQVQAPASVRLSSKVENQQLTGADVQALTLPSLQVVDRNGDR